MLEILLRLCYSKYNNNILVTDYKNKLFCYELI